jgi:hypothetical protein
VINGEATATRGNIGDSTRLDRAQYLGKPQIAKLPQGAAAEATGLYRPHFRYDLNPGHFAGLRSLTSWAIIGREQMQQFVCEAKLFDHLVGADEQDCRDFETERPGGAQIDHQIELGRLHDWQFANLLAF